VTLQVVAIEVSPFEVAPPSGIYLSSVHVTPAFLDLAAAEDLVPPVRLANPGVALRLRDGVPIDQFVADLERRGFGIGPTQAEQAELVKDGIRPQAVALGLMAAAVALAALAVLGQLLARQTFLESGDHGTLRALGLGPPHLWGGSVLRGAAIGTSAAVIAVTVAILVSPLTPIGDARTVEPDPGLSVDPGVSAITAGVTLLAVVVVVAVTAWRVARSAGRELDPVGPTGRRASIAGRGAVRAGLSPVGVTGVRMALEPGRGRTAVPVRVGLMSVTLGIVAMAASLSFAGSLDHLLSTPRLSGWNWDYLVGYPQPVEEEALSDALADAEGIEAFAFGTFFRPFPTMDYSLELDGKSRIDIITFDGGAVGPTVLDGRAPAAPGEILLGTDVLDELALNIGDSVDAVGRVGAFEDPAGLEEVSARLRVVGTGVVPGGELGRGAAMTFDSLAAFDPDFDFALGVVWLRFDSGAEPRKVLAKVGASLGVGGGGQGPPVIGWDPASELANVKQVDRLPFVLSLMMAFLAAGTLAHVLVTTVRARRRDLAILKTLGFSRGQVRRAVAWQATTTALVGLVIGFPLGIAAGRAAWRIFAEQLGVVPEPALPWAPLLVYLAAIVIVANVIAAVPARLAARTRPAAVLKAE